MIEEWVKRYIGIPFSFGEDAPSGADCFGLVRLVYGAEFGIKVQAVEAAGAQQALVDGLLRAKQGYSLNSTPWQSVEAAQAIPGDVVLLAVHGHPAHVGLCVGGGRMLHSSQGHTSGLARLGSVAWRNRILGFYRHCEMC